MHRSAPKIATMLFATCLLAGDAVAEGSDVVPMGTRANLGSPASVLERVLAAEPEIGRRVALPTPTGSDVDLEVSDYWYAEGQLSMHGEAFDAAESSWILKGDALELYGWVVLDGNEVAYEYTTDASGELVVERVPVTKIYPVCEFETLPEGPEFQGPMLTRPGPEPHIGPYDGSDIRTLQSLPGAKLVYYLDFAPVLNGDTPKHLEKEDIWVTWQSVASAYSMYEVNVTTDKEVYDAAGVPNSGIACFLDSDGRSNAPMNTFGTTRCSSNYRKSNGYHYGRTAAHEVGHQMGLDHDRGQPGGEYFSGFPEWKWVPMMGNFLSGNSWGDEALYQWAKGECDSCTTKQDDLEIMKRNLPYREDDHGEDPVPLVVRGASEINAEDNRGQIAENTDSDTFSFEIGAAGGHATLHIDRTEYIGGAALDVAARIVDAEGAVIEESNVKAARYAEFDLDLDPGSYTLVIEGGAEGTPQNGFSTYGSLGFYAIEGEITGIGGDEEAPVVAITSPDSDQQGDTDPFELTVEVTATDNVAVTAVWLEVDGNAVGDEVEEEPYSFDLELEEGEHEIIAYARDGADNVGQSDALNVDVVLDDSSSEEEESGDGEDESESEESGKDDEEDDGEDEAKGDEDDEDDDDSEDDGDSGDGPTPDETTQGLVDEADTGCACAASNSGGGWGRALTRLLGL